MAQPLQLDFKPEPKILTVSLAGRLDGNSAPAFGAQLAEHLEAGTRSVILDLSALEFMSSAGLREFLKLAKRQGANKAVLVGAQPAVGQVLEISGMGSLFLSAKDGDEARGRIAGSNGRGFLGRLFSSQAEA